MPDRSTDQLKTYLGHLGDNAGQAPSLDEIRPMGRHPQRNPNPRILVAVAAALLLVVAGGLFASRSGNSQVVTVADESTSTTAETGPPSTQQTTTPTTTPSTTQEPTDPTTPNVPADLGAPPVLVAIAEDLGAKTVVARSGGRVFTLDSNGDTREHVVAESSWVWSDGHFVYQVVSEDDNTISSAALLDGTVVCETGLPLDHVTATGDGGYVMAVSESYADTDARNGPGEIYEVPFFAVDCATGASQAIESIRTLGIDETGTSFAVRISDRVFVGVSDAEGNADVFNEAGLSVNGDDYAGYHTFSRDGSVVVYGHMLSPHFTSLLKARDTTTGNLLWESELPSAFVGLWVLDDRVVAAIADDALQAASGFGGASALVALDRSTGEQLALVELDPETGLELLYVGD